VFAHVQHKAPIWKCSKAAVEAAFSLIIGAFINCQAHVYSLNLQAMVAAVQLHKDNLCVNRQ
jgi:hypothetical protein